MSERTWQAALVKPLVLVVFFCAALQSGCGVSNTLRFKDSSSPAYAAALSWRPEAFNPDTSHPQQGGIELAVMHFSGDGQQVVTNNNDIQFGGSVITVADTLQDSAEIDRLHLAYKHRFDLWRGLQVEPLLGVTAGELRVHVRPSGGVRLTEETTSTGLVGGGTAVWNFTPQWAASVRALVSLETDDAGSSTLFLSLCFKPTAKFAAQLGYYSYAQEAQLLDGTDGLNGTDVDLHFKGPLASFSVEF
jgi:hypothetical protein